MFKKTVSVLLSATFDIGYVALCPLLTPSRRGILFDVCQVRVTKVLISNVEIHFGVPACSLTFPLLSVLGILLPTLFSM